MAVFNVDVNNAPDPPVVSSKIDLDVNPTNATVNFLFSSVIDNLDGTDLTVKFLDLPTTGIIRTAAGVTVASAEQRFNDDTIFEYVVSTFPEMDTKITVSYSVVDAVQGLTSTGYIDIIIQGVLDEDEAFMAKVAQEDLIFIGSAVCISGVLISVINMFFKRKLALSMATIKELTEISDLWFSFGFCIFDLASDTLVYFLVYQYCATFKYIYLSVLAFAMVVSCYHAYALLKDIQTVNQETDKTIEKDSGMDYLKTIRDAESGKNTAEISLSEFSETLRQSEERRSEDERRSSSDGEKEDEISRATSTSLLRSPIKTMYSGAFSANKGGKSAQDALFGSADMGNSGNLVLGTLRKVKKKLKIAPSPNDVERSRQKSISDIKRSKSMNMQAELVGCLNEIKRLNGLDKREMRRFHRARAQLYVVFGQDIPMIFLNVYFISFGGCEVNESSKSYLVFILTVVATALFTGRRFTSAYDAMKSAPYIQRQQLLSLFKDMIKKLDR